MAKATLIPAEPEVQLTLSKDEAQTLVDVISLAGGNPSTTRRKYAQNIMDAMRKVGYVYIMDAYEKELKGSQIYFHEKLIGGSKEVTF
jgi:hypothetical protein